MTDAPTPPGPSEAPEPAVILNQKEQLKPDQPVMASVASSASDIVRIISETKFTYGIDQHEYKAIKIEIAEQKDVQTDAVECDMTLISDQNVYMTLTANASWDSTNNNGHVVFYNVHEFRDETVDSENTRFLNLCKNFQLLGPWIQFPQELLGDINPTDSEDK